MGHVKDRLIQENDQGWRCSGDLEICWRCVINPCLRTFVKVNAAGHTCGFCNRTSRTAPSTVPFDDLMEVIVEAVDSKPCSQ